MSQRSRSPTRLTRPLSPASSSDRKPLIPKRTVAQSRATARAAPSRAATTVSRMNGRRMEKAEAPTMRWIAVSLRRVHAVSRIVVEMSRMAQTTMATARASAPQLRAPRKAKSLSTTSRWSSTLSTPGACSKAARMTSYFAGSERLTRKEAGIDSCGTDSRAEELRNCSVNRS